MSDLLADVERAKEIAESMLAVAARDVDRLLPKKGPGMRMPKDDQLPKWLAAMREAFPPDEWVMPDGTIVVESVYVLALPYVEGGPELLAKIRDLTEEY